MLRARQTKQLSLTGSLDLEPYDFRNPGLQALSFLRLGLISAPLVLEIIRMMTYHVRFSK